MKSIALALVLMMTSTANAVDLFYVTNSSGNYLILKLFTEKLQKWLPDFDLYPDKPNLVRIQDDGLYFVRLQKDRGYQEDLDWVNFPSYLASFETIPTLDVMTLYRIEKRYHTYTVRHAVPEKRVKTKSYNVYRWIPRTRERTFRDPCTGKVVTRTYRIMERVAETRVREIEYTVWKWVYETKQKEYTVRVPGLKMELVAGDKRVPLPTIPAEKRESSK